MVRGASKRAAALSDDESQASPSKRVRVKERGGNPQRHSQSQRGRLLSESRDEDDAEMIEDEDSEAEFERDASDDEDIDWDNEEENLAALQRVRDEERADGSADLRVPHAGVIKSVRVVNFMNHQHFSFDNFGRKINFIVGHNGSGKSAILTAIAVALGARASVTGRGSGVKDLIRRGADKATIVVTLWNRGQLAYNSEKYPNQIVIERSFDNKGGNTWKFRAERDGPVLDTKKSELDNITAHFAINMDSPLTLLTQDMAKSFLASSDESKLYGLFLSGSSLKQLSEYYDNISQLIVKMRADVKSNEENLPATKAKADHYERIVKAAQRQKEMKEEHQALTYTLAWAFVVERENQLEGDRADLEKEQRRLEKIRADADTIRNQQAKLEEDMAHMSRELDEMRREMAPLQLQAKDLKRDRDTKKRNLVQTRGLLDEVKGDIESKRIEIKALDRRLADLASGVDQTNPREQDLRENIKRVQQYRAKMVRDAPGLKNAIPEADGKVDQAKIALHEVRARCEEVNNKLGMARDQRDNLGQQTSDPLAAFGSQMHRVLAAIDRGRWRAGPPIGPLGRYVKLKDERYRDIVQAVLGNLLCSFIVRCHEDKDELVRILKHCAQQGYVPGNRRRGLPSITIHKGDNFDFSSGDLSRLGTTILSVLEVTDERVVRILVDMASVEKRLLSLTQRSANDLITRCLDNGAAHVHVFSADMYVSRGDRTMRNSGPQSRWTGNNLFVKDTAAALGALREQVGALEREDGALREELKARSNDVRDCEKGVRDARDQYKRVEKGLRESERKMNEYEDELAAIQRDDGDAPLLNAKDEAEKALQENEVERARLDEHIKEMEAELGVCDDDIERIHEKEAKFLPRTTQKKDAIKQLAEEQLKCVNTHNYRTNAIQTQEKKIGTRAQEIAHLEAELAQWIEGATNMCERREVRESPNQVKRRVDALKASLDAAERESNVNLPDAIQKYNHYCQLLRTTKENHNKQFKLVAALEKCLRRRQDRWVALRQHLSTRVSSVFTFNLYTRGFNGTVKFDHMSGKLRLTVNTTGSASKAALQDFAKTANRLSGGERSYSTVCFLLALWETCPTSIACLDEWDVFLDNINRQLAGKLIMEGAREMIGKQFILITPLDMGGLQVGGENNKVIRLGDPERGQGTLPM